MKIRHLLPLAKTPTKGSTTSTALRRFFTRALQLLPFDNKMVQSVSGVQTLMIKSVQSVSIVEFYKQIETVY